MTKLQAACPYAVLSLCVALLASACESRGATLTVRVQSGLRAGSELTQVTARIASTADCGSLGGTTNGVTLTEDRQADLVRGVLTVAEFRDVSPGVHAVIVAGTIRRGRELSRCVVVSVSGDRVLRVPLTTDCPPDRCPEPGGTPGFTECLNGRCVDPRCEADDPDTSELCCDPATLGALCESSPTLCRASAGCAPGPMCAGARECVGGVCVEPAEDLCDDGSYCAAASGLCEPDEEGLDAGRIDGGIEPDASAGPADASLDVAPDATPGLDAFDMCATGCSCPAGYSGDGRVCTSGVLDAFTKASDTGAGDLFGYTIALSDDGQTLAVGSPSEDGSVGGIGSPSDEGASDSGAVYVFRRVAGAWTFDARIKASNPGAGDSFGLALALDGDGTTLAVGAQGEASSGTGVDGMVDDAAPYSGAVYVYRRTSGTWRQEAFVKATNTGSMDAFGAAVSLSDDGGTLVVGAPGEDSGGTLVGSTPDETGLQSGAVYVYRRSGGTWSFEAFVKASNTGLLDAFGQTVALSANGTVLAVGAPTEDSSAIGVGGASDELGPETGAVYLYRRVSGAWGFEAFVKPGVATSPVVLLGFGAALALSADGTTLAVGARHEPTAGLGVGVMPNAGAPDSGAVFVYRHSGGTWAHEAFVKSPETSMGDWFGNAVALSGDGSILVVGAQHARSFSGAAFVYRRGDPVWMLDAAVTDPAPRMSDRFGWSVAISADAEWLAVGAVGEDSSAMGVGAAPDELAMESGAAYVLRR